MASRPTTRTPKAKQTVLGTGATALYIRVSTDKQATEGYSLDAQRGKLVAFCGVHGWPVDDANVYVDEGQSAKNTDRPQFQRMHAAVAAGSIARIVTVKLDRLSRNTRDFLALLDFCDEHGVGIVSIAEQFDTGTPVGRAVVTVLMTFAQLERDQIAERMQSGRDEKARQGSRNGAPVPYGYSMVDGRYTVVDDQADVVRGIFHEFLKGASLRGIAAGLNDSGIPAPKGKKWYPAAIRYILDNGMYAGLVQYNGASVPSSDVPAIVDCDDYKDVARWLLTLHTGNPTFGK